MKKAHKLLTAALVLWLFLVGGCKKEQLNDCFSSTGKDVTIERNLMEFNKLRVGDKFRVVLIQDTISPNRVRITGGENLMPGIQTLVTDQELHIDNCNVCNFVRSYQRIVTVEVFIKDLTEIVVTGAAEISTRDTLHLNNLHIDHMALEDTKLTVNIKNELFIQSINSGGATFKGRAKILKGSIEEITNIDARDLACEEVLIDTHSPLDCYVNASKLLFVNIYSSGNIFYLTEPTDLKEINDHTGTGQLIKLD
ncbi:MAG: hypothetical protein ACI8ZN_001752 [Bacteroidia bacterium]|jgi:hypothetical protein